ncbi:MAG TPA: nucleoside monophosphate kinase [Candidatus Saccharimonadales bacterium]|nr:nucleoside monophosphate kinase [Candidatus Saccharimonadales bacterium]
MEISEQMQKKHIITIAGKPGSGKSTTSKAVAAELGFQHFSSGDLFRAIGKERGIDVLQANLSGEKGTDIDYLVDQRLRDIGSAEDEIVIDSRMAWHWMPYSFKVYLDLDLETAAQRVLSSMDPTRLKFEHIPNDVKEYADILQQRLDSETRRYEKFYSVDPYNTTNYDLVVDTKANNPNQVFGIVLNAYRDWLKK